MALSETQLVLLAALANQPMTGMTGLNAEDDTVLQNAEDEHNAIALEQIPGLGSDWKVQEITTVDVQRAIQAEAALRGVAATTGDRDFVGMAAVVFRNDVTGEAVISFRGTQLEDGAAETGFDIAADLDLGAGVAHTQVYAAYYFLKAALNLLSPQQTANLTLTGHSLGGGLASLMGMYSGINTVVFDPALSLRVARDMLGEGDRKSVV